ncbi:MAG TPA: hypothetical protein VKE50_12205, partial [Thermoanaerobaculia bacterium]|nr:hypothetical protein [Thermoanaerobaculia bacterium]
MNQSPSSRSLLQHPIIRTLLFERFLLTTSATLAFAAVAMGRVRIPEIPRLMDFRLLSLFVGLLFAGALISQVVSNVPAALLLAPAAAGPLAFQGLLYAVTAGACGSPVGSIGNLIGAQIYVTEG